MEAYRILEFVILFKLRYTDGRVNEQLPAASPSELDQLVLKIMVNTSAFSSITNHYGSMIHTRNIPKAPTCSGYWGGKWLLCSTPI